MSTKLILVRHGQTRHNLDGRQAGWVDTPLTDLGLAQAECLADHIFLSYHLDALYSSPLARALDTALAIGRKVDLVTVVREDLKEMSWGGFENLTKAEVARKYPKHLRHLNLGDDPNFSYPDGGESLPVFYARMRKAFKTLIALHPDETVGVASHGGLLGAFIADIIEPKLVLSREYNPRNCSVTVVEVDRNRPRIILLDDCSFLESAGLVTSRTRER